MSPRPPGPCFPASTSMPSIMKCSTAASSRVVRMMEFSRSVRVEALPAGDEAATSPQDWRVGIHSLLQVGYNARQPLLLTGSLGFGCYLPHLYISQKEWGR